MTTKQVNKVESKKQSLLSKSIEHALEVTDNENSEKLALAMVEQVSDTHLKINNDSYLLVKDHAAGLDLKRLAMRYNNVLKKYDYIVGDWGYGQLRLRGFYDDHRPQAKIDQKIGTLQDYLLEYCNFGCAYFVLEREHKLTNIPPRPKTGHPQQRFKRSSLQRNSKNNKKQSNPKNSNVRNKKAKKITINNKFRIRKINNRGK
ncbi:YutD family protein [Lactobacillus sp. DCY120]|uniref:YutD family protein n=1 Tax=Bombilactobacillus apium TaxID=2675299 RepID=A0A850R8L4_9LACO|nr:YutD family protein [Bombilactobacillus apium]NVY97187.1 YutD family protein [Bombilactobacillus apium]